MALEGLRGYLQIASGLTEVTRARAAEVARVMLTNLQEGFDAAGSAAQLRKQATAMAEELLATSRANRDLLLALIRSEVERTVSRLGLLSNEDLERAKALADSLEARIRDLEDRLLGPRSTPTRPAPAATDAAAGKEAAAASRPGTAKRASAKKTVGVKPPAKKASKRTATKSTATTAERAAGAGTTKKTTTKRATTKKATTKKATAKKAAELRATPPSTGGPPAVADDQPPSVPSEPAGPGPATPAVESPQPQAEPLPEPPGGSAAGAEAPTETRDQP